MLIEGLELGDGFRAAAMIEISVAVFGADFLAKHEVDGLHVPNLEGLLGFGPSPTFLLPAGSFGTD
jgi:hypothetical protein